MALHSGVAGFNPAPRPHSRPVWDMYEQPEKKETEAEKRTLERLIARFGPAGPPKTWCKYNTICQAPPHHDRNTYQRVKEESKSFGVMQRLQPRQSTKQVTRWRSNPEVKAYFKDTVNGANMSTRVLSKSEAKLMNMYYPNQPWVIMDVSNQSFSALCLYQSCLSIIAVMLTANQGPYDAFPSLPYKTGRQCQLDNHESGQDAEPCTI